MQTCRAGSIHFLTIKADIPGVAKDDIKVAFENGVVTVQGDRKQEKEEENKHFHRIESFYGSFTRSFSLPENADTAGLKAAASDAVQVPVEQAMIRADGCGDWIFNSGRNRRISIQSGSPPRCWMACWPVRKTLMPV
jgi:hypothetical protein